MVGARFALTPAAARRLRTALKLKRTPSTKALGKLSVGVADLALPDARSRRPARPDAPRTPAPRTATPAPTATPTADPDRHAR